MWMEPVVKGQQVTQKVFGKRIGPRTTCRSVAEAKGEASYVCDMVRMMDCVRPCGSVTGGTDVAQAVVH